MKSEWFVKDEMARHLRFNIRQNVLLPEPADSDSIIQNIRIAPEV